MNIANSSICMCILPNVCVCTCWQHAGVTTNACSRLSQVSDLSALLIQLPHNFCVACCPEQNACSVYSKSKSTHASKLPLATTPRHHPESRWCQPPMQRPQVQCILGQWLHLRSQAHQQCLTPAAKRESTSSA